MSSVADIITGAENRINDAVSQANSYLDVLTNIAATSDWTNPDILGKADANSYLRVNYAATGVLEPDLTFSTINYAANKVNYDVANPTDLLSANYKNNSPVDLSSSTYKIPTSNDLNAINYKANTPIDLVPVNYKAAASTDLATNSYKLAASTDLVKTGYGVVFTNAVNNTTATSTIVEEPTGITENAKIDTTDVAHFTLSEIDLTNVSTVRSTSGTSVVTQVPTTATTNLVAPSNIADISKTIIDIDLPPLPTLATLTPPSGDVRLDDVVVTLSDAPTVSNNLTLSFETIADPSAINVEQYLIPNPTVDYLVPSNNFSFVETAYHSAFKDSLLDALLKEMTVGATGINPADELLLFQRGRDREAATYKDSAQQIARQMAARGFKIPPSAMAGLLSKAQDTMNKAMSGINRDIMLKRADLYVQARQFAIQQGVQLETAMLSYHGAMMERAMNAAKFVADFGIQYHNLQVQKFKDQLDVWKTVSDVRSQWVDNAIKATKSYELKLEKMKLVGEQNSQRIQLQDSMNRAVDLANNIRKTELEIGSFKLENNKLRIEQSKLLTQNYAESMRGNMIAFQAYSEAVKAQTLKNEPIRLAIDLHREQRETVSNEFAMKTQAEELKLKTLSANLQRSEQLLQKYYKELDVETMMVAEKSKRLGIELESWKAKIDVEKINNELKIEVGKINNQNSLEAKKATQQFKLEASKLNAQLSTDVSKLNAQLGFDMSKSNSLTQLEVDKANKQTQLEIEKLNKQFAFDVDKLNKNTSLEIDRLNKNTTLEIDKLNKANTLKIDELNKSHTLEVDKLNKTMTLDVDKNNKATLLKIDELNKTHTLEIDKLNKQTLLDVDKLNKARDFEADKINKERVLEVDKLNKSMQFEVEKFNKVRTWDKDKFNKEVQIDAQYKTGNLFLEGVKVNNAAYRQKDEIRIHDDEVALKSAQVGAEVMMSIISGAQSSLGAIATLAE